MRQTHIKRSATKRMALGVIFFFSTQAGVVVAQDGLLSIPSLVEDDTTYPPGQVVVRFANMTKAKERLGLTGPRSIRSIGTALSSTIIRKSTVRRWPDSSVPWAITARAQPE